MDKPSTADTQFFAALSEDPAAVGAYLGQVALKTREYLNEGENFDVALRVAVGVTTLPDAMLKHYYSDEVSSVERRCVAILIEGS